MKLKFFIIGLILSSIVTFLATPFAAPSLIHRESEDDMRTSFESTCVVESKEGGGMGSGTMLNTGYILTAAHVIDIDMDGLLESDQRTRTVVFFGNQYKASLAYIDTENDFAFLKPLERIPVKGVSVSKDGHALGDKVYAIGATGGHPLNISPGLILSPGMSGSPRASCYVSVGNSGGGIFDSKKEVLGVVSMVGIIHRSGTVSMMVPVQGERGFGLVWVQGTVNFISEVNNNCLFVPIGKIRSVLTKHSVSSILDGVEEESFLDKFNSPFYIGIVATVVNLGIFLWVVIYVRRYLVGS